MPQLLPTTVVGSFPQPDWLVNRDMLRSRLPPRVLAREVWRVPEPWLEQAQDDATLLAIREMEQAGIDVITDGEIRRESYSNHFASSLAGVDLDRPGEAVSRTGKKDIVPRIVGPIRRTRPVEVRALELLRRNTDRRVKITVPGPFTMSQQAVDEHYRDAAALAMAFAVAVNEELHALVAAGADVVQIDEPYLQSRIPEARAFAVPAIERALAGVSGTTALHTCFGYAHYIKDKPGHYAFLEELARCPANQLAIAVMPLPFSPLNLATASSSAFCCGPESACHSVTSTGPVMSAIRRSSPEIPPRWPERSDLMLPELDGMTVARRVREDSDVP